MSVYLVSVKLARRRRFASRHPFVNHVSAPGPHRIGTLLLSSLLFCAVGCTTRPATTSPPVASNDAVSLERAEAALAAGDHPRAIALFRRYIAREDIDSPQRAAAHPGLARAYEAVGDFDAAIQSYAAALALDPQSPQAANWLANQGAAEAELERWEASAESFQRAFDLSEQGAGEGALPSTRIELLARRAYALFSAQQYEATLETLDLAEAICAEALEKDTERFSTFYFVGMMRFYRAAVLHARFRAIEVSLPETKMAEDFEKKLALLVEAQEAYNATIATKHVYWVSAAGFQLGHLFEEFYDALMHAPVPDWLDERQRRVYYQELKEQLRPVVNKAIWVFERNLETARRLGYETEFTERTEAALARLQSILLSADTQLGEPHPELAPLDSGSVTETDPEREARRSPLDRKLFLPAPTPL